MGIVVGQYPIGQTKIGTQRTMGFVLSNNTCHHWTKKKKKKDLLFQESALPTLDDQKSFFDADKRYIYFRITRKSPY